ncbi:MAG TPA: glutamate--tRNA ligase family protein [Patescibacteria group bacterium]|jgi:glutamyl-tRNA synthetase
MAEKVITRFAPSPTGYLHVGGARTALFAWLWAKKDGGEFRLRIEDTDRKRLVEDAEDQIKESLEWLGLDWHDTVLRQSERIDEYRKQAKRLVEAGFARESAEKEGTVIRFKWPEPLRPVAIEPFQGRQKIMVDPQTVASAFEEFVLIKSDGYPTYNFAHIIDDLETGVTDVIRGDEFTSSLHKYYAIYQALGRADALPRFYHVPPILGSDKAKLSKRHGAQDVLDYRAEGYLPEALANFIALIGWNPGDDREFFASLDELREAFDLSKVQRSPGVFDPEKLAWLNGEHIKALAPGDLLERAATGGFWEPGRDRAYDERVLGLATDRVRTLAELRDIRTGYFYEAPKVAVDRLVGKENPETVGVWLERVLRDLTKLPEAEWKSDRIERTLNDVRDELDLEPKQLFPVLRIVVTDADRTPPLWDVFEVLGKSETVSRLEAAQDLVA